MSGTPSGSVAAVSRNADHTFSKANQTAVYLRTGLGVDQDAHQGTTVRHRSRVARDPNQPNLRQVHLIHEELFAELLECGFDVGPGQLGENITTRGLSLLTMPAGTRLRIGSTAIIELTGLRNPCAQLDAFRPGLMAAVLGRRDDGSLVRKAGVMAVVVAAGHISPGDEIIVESPALPHVPLRVV